MQHVKLIWLRALLSDWQDLEPAQTLCLFKNADEIVPFFTRQRARDVDLEALQVRLVLGRHLLVFLLLYGATALLFLVHGVVDVVRFGGRLEALAEREVAVDDERLVLGVLVLLLREEDHHLALDLGVRVRREEVLRGELLDEHFLHHGDFAGVGDVVLRAEVLSGLIHRRVPASVHIRLFGAALAQAFSFLNTVRITNEMTRSFIHLAFFATDSAFSGLGLCRVFGSLVGRIMGFPLVRCGAFDVTLELLQEVLIAQVLLLLLFLLFALSGCFDLDLIFNIERAAIVTLQIRPPQLENSALLLTGLKEAISDMRHYILFANLCEVGVDFHAESRTVLAHAHLLLDRLNVVLRSIVLLLFQHLHVRAAIPLPHMLDEVGAIADLLALQSVDKWTVPLVEAI